MKKKVIIGVIVVLALLLLIPIPMKLRDGGSVEYRALLYTVTKYHQLDLQSETGYIDGVGIKILRMEVYNSTNKKVYTQTDYAYMAIEEIPQDYILEQAIQDECFVVSLSQTYNKKIYDDFISNVKNKKDGYIRAIYFTDEGDMLIRDVEFENDNNVFYVSIDNTRDEYSSQEDRKINKYVFTNFVQENNEKGEYSYFENEDQNDRLFVLYCPANEYLDSTNNVSSLEQKSFVGTVLEETTTYMIVEPNEDEDERKSSDKIQINYGVDHEDYLYGVGRKVLISYSGYIMETYPAQINTNNISVEGYSDFEIIVEKSEDKTKKKILNSKDLDKYNGDFDLYYYGLKDVKVKVDNKTIFLEEALKTGKITLNGIISKANKEVRETEEKYSKLEESQSSPKLYPYSEMYKDGGSQIYYYETYTILKNHTLDGNRDVYMGVPEMRVEVRE